MYLQKSILGYKDSHPKVTYFHPQASEGAWQSSWHVENCDLVKVR